MSDLYDQEPVVGVVAFDPENYEPTIFSTTDMPQDEGINDIQV